MAADLIEAGVDPHERLPAAVRGPALPAPRAARARAGERGALRRRRDHAWRRLTRARLRGDRRAGDRLRGRSWTTCASVEGTKVAVLVRELLGDDRHGRSKVSLRATDGTVDVSRDRPRARRRRAPPGGRRLHRALARASWWRRSASRSPSSFRADVSAPEALAPGVILFAKPAGMTSHDVVAAVRRTLPRGVKVGHAGTLDPFATGLLLVLVGRATRAQRYLLGLPKTYRAVARLGWTLGHRRPRRRAGADRAGCPTGSRIPTGNDHAAPARVLGRARWAASALYEKARRGEPQEGEARPVTVHRAELVASDGEQRHVRDRMLVGHLRAPAGRRRWATPTARSSSARRSARSGSRTPTPTRSCRWRRRWPSCPSGRWAPMTRRGGPWRPGAGRAGRGGDARRCAADLRGRAGGHRRAAGPASCSPS